MPHASQSEINADPHSELKSILKKLLPLPLSDFSKLAEHPLIAGDLDAIKTYCKKELVTTLGPNASTTHPVLNDEYRLCFTGVNVLTTASDGTSKANLVRVRSLYDVLFDQRCGLLSIQNLERWRDYVNQNMESSWEKYEVSCIDESRSVQSIDGYVNLWGGNSYQPLVKTLEKWIALLKLKTHLRSFEGLVSGVVTAKSRCSFLSLFLVMPRTVTMEDVSEFFARPIDEATALLP